MRPQALDQRLDLHVVELRPAHHVADTVAGRLGALLNPYRPFGAKSLQSAGARLVRVRIQDVAIVVVGPPEGRLQGTPKGVRGPVWGEGIGASGHHRTPPCAGSPDRSQRRRGAAQCSGSPAPATRTCRSQSGPNPGGIRSAADRQSLALPEARRRHARGSGSKLRSPRRGIRQWEVPRPRSSGSPGNRQTRAWPGTGQETKKRSNASSPNIRGAPSPRTTRPS